MTLVPNFDLPLRDPSPRELRRLLRHVRRRDCRTMMEQVAREVGPSVYAEFMPKLSEVPVWIRRDHIIGLPPGTYAILLSDVLAQWQDKGCLA